MLKLTSKFPFFKVEKFSYEKIVMNDHENTEKQKEMIKFVTGILSVNQIPINKIRFVFMPSFLYDIDKDKINPVYQIMMPNLVNKGRKKRLILEIGKPENSFTIKINEYVDIDDYETIKPIVKSSKKGMVMYINEIDFQGVVGACNLDVCIDDHNQLLENYEYNS